MAEFHCTSLTGIRPNASCISAVWISKCIGSSLIVINTIFPKSLSIKCRTHRALWSTSWNKILCSISCLIDVLNPNAIYKTSKLPIIWSCCLSTSTDEFFRGYCVLVEIAKAIPTANLISLHIYLEIHITISSCWSQLTPPSHKSPCLNGHDISNGRRQTAANTFYRLIVSKIQSLWVQNCSINSMITKIWIIVCTEHICILPIIPTDPKADCEI